jgi:hypothetical protein
MTRALLIEKSLPPGAYSVRYRVDFNDGGKIIEGQADLMIGQRAQITLSASGLRR